MSLPSDRNWKWWLGLAGLLLFVAFPWVFYPAPSEVYYGNFILHLLTRLISLFGLAYTASFLALLVHEAGHWLFGRLVGIGINRFVVGAGASPVTFRCFGIEFSFAPGMYSGYVTEIPERKNLQFTRQLVFCSGGMVAVVLFVGALYFVPVAHGESPAFESFRFMTLVSAVMGIWASALPRMCTIEGRTTPNDALLIVEAWKNRGREDIIWRQTELNLQFIALCENKQHVEAARVLEQMVAAEPENNRLRKHLASLHAAVGNWDKALALHHDLIERSAPGTRGRIHAIDETATIALRLGSREELACLRPLVQEAFDKCQSATLAGTLGSILVELDDVAAGVKLLNRCVKTTDSDVDKGVATAYLAKAALKLGQPQRAAELLEKAKTKSDHFLVRRVVDELDPQFAAQADPSSDKSELSGRSPEGQAL